MRVLWRLRGYTLRYRWSLAAGSVVALFGVASTLLVPRLIGEAIDGLLTSGVGSDQLLLAGAVLLLGLVTGAAGYAQYYISFRVWDNASADLRKDLLKKMLSLSFGFYDSQRTGDLMFRVVWEVRIAQKGIAVNAIRWMTVAIVLVAVMTLIVLTNWRLALVGFFFVSVFSWRAVAGTTGGEFERIRTRVREGFGRLASVLQENLAGMKVVKAFGARAHETAKFDRQASLVTDLLYSAEQWWPRRSSLLMFVSTVATGAIVWLGGREIVAGRLTPGELVTIIFYMALIMSGPVSYFAHMILELPREITAARRIVEILDAESTVQERPGAVSASIVRGHVKFEAVTVSYDSVDSAVHNVDFEMQPGQKVALLGAPGSGKSTLAHLIPRFYDVTDGRVLIDGTDIRDMTLASLRRHVGLVMQDVFIFGGTWGENISYGADDPSENQVRRAARIAQLDDYIQELPEGYDTLIGERGATLSGGQRQRLAIARTVLVDPPILILDDSTSSVDVETEYRLQRALAEVVRGRTTLVVAHRLSAVRDADLILVLDRGRVAEQGTHEQLLGGDGLYRQIFDLQLAMVEEGAAADVGGAG